MGIGNKRLVAVAVLAAILVSGCTGNMLSPQDRLTLKDLYTTAGGLYAHWKLALWMEAYHRGIGAKESHIEMPMPWSRKRSDYVAVFQEPTGLVAHIYEFKPFSNRRDATLLEGAKAQVDAYISLLTKGGKYVAVRPGRKFTTLGPMKVPHEYTPELVERCMEMRVQTYENLAPGVVFYWFVNLRGQSGSRNCDQRDEERRSVDIGSFLHYVSYTTIPRNYKATYLQVRLAQVYHEEGPAAIQEMIYYPFEADQNPEKDTPAKPRKRDRQVTDYLMKRDIPLTFKQPVSTPLPVPLPAPKGGAQWECQSRDCA